MTLDAKPKCRRHHWMKVCDCRDYSANDERDCCCVGGTVCWLNPIYLCTRCPARKDAAASRRGRLNKNRGNAIEREVGKRLGLKRVGQFGGPDDLSGELFAAQVKSGGYFSERQWAWLKAVPVKAGQTALLVITDTPGPGKRRRAVVMVDIDDWIALHGPEL